jgi:hypothetical protein
MPSRETSCQLDVAIDLKSEVSRHTAQYRMAGIAHYILRPFVEARNAAPVHIFILM